jgi:hypothetical protein
VSGWPSFETEALRETVLLLVVPTIACNAAGHLTASIRWKVDRESGTAHRDFAFGKVQELAAVEEDDLAAVIVGRRRV